MEIISAFQENDIDGSVFCEMTACQLREIAPKIGDQVKLKRLQDSEKSVSMVYIVLHHAVLTIYTGNPVKRPSSGACSCKCSVLCYSTILFVILSTGNPVKPPSSGACSCKCSVLCYSTILFVILSTGNPVKPPSSGACSCKCTCKCSVLWSYSILYYLYFAHRKPSHLLSIPLTMPPQVQIRIQTGISIFKFLHHFHHLLRMQFQLAYC